MANDIDEFIEKSYKNYPGNAKEIQELKLEMRIHLQQTVEELVKQGHTEDESLQIAKERFGTSEEIEETIQQMVTSPKKFVRMVLIAAITSLLLLVCVVGYMGHMGFLQQSLDHQELADCYHSKVMKDVSAMAFPILQKAGVDHITPEIKAAFDSQITQYFSRLRESQKPTFIAVFLRSSTGKYIAADMSWNGYGWMDKNFYSQPVFKDAPILYFYQPDKEDWGHQGMCDSGEDYKVGNWTINIGFMGKHSSGPYLQELAQSTWCRTALQILSVCCWLLFSIWVMLVVYYQKSLKPVWVIIFIIGSIFGYGIYRIWKKCEQKLLRYE